MGDPLKAGKAQVSLTLLQKAVLCAVHLDVIRERFLAPLLGFPVAAHDLADALLKPTADTLHVATLR